MASRIKKERKRRTIIPISTPPFLKGLPLNPAPVAHAWKPSYSGGRDNLKQIVRWTLS
jgi:hypothetical protein